MNEPEREQDGSTGSGYLVHSASSGRWVKVVAYLEGATQPVEGQILCHSAETARRIAALLLDEKPIPMPSSEVGRPAHRLATMYDLDFYVVDEQLVQFGDGFVAARLATPEEVALWRALERANLPR